MNWDQIETKWALMTRRIRADLCESRTEVTTGRVQTLDRRGTSRPSVADVPLAARQTSESKTSAQ